MAEEKKETQPYKGQKVDWNDYKRRNKRQKAAQKRIRGDIRYSKSTVSEQKRKAVGGYTVEPGGGTPARGYGRGVMKKDFWVAEDADDAKRLKKEHPGEPVRTLQKRNKDGTFGHNFDMGKDPLPESTEGKYGTKPETYKDKENVEMKKGDVIIDKGKRYVITEDVTYDEFMKTVKDYVNKYIEVKKGRKSGLEKGLGKQSGILTYLGGNKRKGYFMSGEQMLKEAVQYKKEKGKKGKVIRKDWIKKKGTEAKPKSTPNYKFNVELAKNNPGEFFNKHKKVVQAVMDLNDELNVYQAIDLIASGQFTDFESLKKWYEEE